MQNKIVSKTYGIYDAYTTILLPLMLTVFFLLCVGLSIFFTRKYLVNQYDPTVYFLLAILLCPWVYIFIELFRNGLIHRLLLRVKIDKKGMHCYVFGYKAYTITWDDIHTFGIIGYTYSHVGKTLILFSTNKNEYAPKNAVEANKVSQNRIVFQFRTDLWNVLRCNMPDDMQKKLNYAASRKQDCFHKR